MRRGRVRVGGIAVGLLCAALVLPTPPAYASAPGLSISVPGSASFGSVATGARTITASLGTITVATSSTLPHVATWTATVSTSGFSTGAGSAAERVPASSVSYLSRSATATSGFAAGACVAGQTVAVTLAVAQTAFSCTGTSIAASTSVSWNPQISVAVGAGNVAGTYSGTITHSVV
ncbi:MAG: hypothetical protein JWP11_1186 [Frankiales bacterium]|nr:hypothetical protein [Frankiales bacterium]